MAKQRYSVHYASMFGEAAKERCLGIAAQVAAEANQRAPEGESGKLKGGYVARPTKYGAEIANPDAPYWVDVEFGHAIANQYGDQAGRVGQRAHVRPAIEQVRRELAAGDG